jgi:hypothetical protein
MFRKLKIEFLRKSIENKKEAAQIGFETASILPKVRLNLIFELSQRFQLFQIGNLVVVFVYLILS